MLCNSQTLISRALRSLKMLLKTNTCFLKVVTILGTRIYVNAIEFIMSIFPMLLTITIPAVKEHSWLRNYKITTSLSHTKYQSLGLHFQHSQPLQGYL